MRYTKTVYVGELETVEEFEGEPEDIIELISKFNYTTTLEETKNEHLKQVEKMIKNAGTD